MFLAANVTVGPLESSPNKTRGSIFIPEEGVDPVAYAPYARALALQGYFAIILNDR